MASQGQRFRRRALRRGYKVEEVDAFLDKVEATLAGEPVNPPAASQEVHDVVFRVRFGGYDEWQVDLHLDRVERQLAELEERRGRGHDPRMSERMDPTYDRLGPPERMAPMMRDERSMPPVAPPMPPRPLPAQAGPHHDPYGRYDEQTSTFGAGGLDPARGDFDRARGDFEGARGDFDPARGGFDGARGDFEGARGGFDGPRGPAGPGGYGGPDDRFDGFESGRQGKMDMTAEIRLPDRDGRDPRGLGMGAPPALGPMGGPPGPTGDLARIDQMRRTFQVRRFGSGYDPDQVDRLFEGILTAMTGRGPMPVNPADLTMTQFGLVPGGYYEAEVDTALQVVQDILRRR